MKKTERKAIIDAIGQRTPEYFGWEHFEIVVKTLFEHGYVIVPHAMSGDSE
jgi:hypothetical protein